jgi:hypothetical protein
MEQNMQTNDIAGDVLLRHAADAMLAHATDVAALRAQNDALRRALDGAFQAVQGAYPDPAKVPPLTGYAEWLAARKETR